MDRARSCFLQMMGIEQWLKRPPKSPPKLIFVSSAPLSSQEASLLEAILHFCEIKKKEVQVTTSLLLPRSQVGIEADACPVISLPDLIDQPTRKKQVFLQLSKILNVVSSLPKREDKALGISLIELLYTLAILAIGMMLILPGVYTFMGKYRMQGISQDIQSAVHYAQMLAFTTGKKIELQPETTQSGWTSGMQLVKTSNDLSQRTILYIWRWKNPDIKVQWISSQKKAEIVFSPIPGHTMSGGHFLLEWQRMKKKVVLNRLGRVSEVEVSDG